MGRYIVRRLLWMVVSLVVVSVLTFAIFYLLPSGDPAQLRAGPRASPAYTTVGWKAARSPPSPRGYPSGTRSKSGIRASSAPISSSF